jgi:uncharacterized repeat protein (TIGR01451 family)/fimbrial isopeptide formation D2 family protein
MNLIKKITGGWKKVLGIALVSALISQLVAPALVANAASPRFNFLQDDLAMIRGANKSAGEVTWHKPVDGLAGDTFAGIIYFHNGVVDTTAHNTNVKVSMPAVSADNKLVINASVSADGVSAVSDSMTVNLNENAKASLIPGTVQWFPNFTSFSVPSETLLYGQNGSELFGQGLNVGDVHGCWQYIGYVVFQFKTEALPSANIVKSKIAKNLATGTEGVNISAKAGDQVVYTLTTKNTGTASANVAVSDDISDILELADFNEASIGGTLSNGILTYPTVNITAGETNIRTFKVTLKNPQPKNAQNGKHFDGIMENIYGNIVLVKIGKMPSVRLEKSVRSVTINEAGFSKENQAKPGDVLEYQIFFSNSGEKADDVVISDILPANVSFVSGSASMTKGGVKTILSDKALFTGAQIGSLNQNEDGIIKFKVKISSGIATGELLTNTAILKFGKEVLKDTARTRVVVTPIEVTPALPMTGPSTPILSLLFTLTGTLSMYYLKSRKVLSLLKR